MKNHITGSLFIFFFVFTFYFYEQKVGDTFIKNELVKQTLIKDSIPFQLNSEKYYLKNVKLNLKELDLDEKTKYVYAHFKKPLEPYQIKKIERKGINFIEKLEKNIWLLSPKRIESIKTISQIDFVTPIPKNSKYESTILAKSNYEDWELTNEGLVLLNVLFHKDVFVSEVKKSINNIGGYIINYDKKAFNILKSGKIAIPKESINDLINLETVKFIQDADPPNINHNRNNAQPMSNVDNVQTGAFNLLGEGITIGVWDANGSNNAFQVNDDHPDLQGRITLGETGNQDDHATHVAGTIASSGINFPDTEGMAPRSNIVSYSGDNDRVEMINASNDESIQISNHSYGIPIGWDGTGMNFNSQNTFGQYDIQSQEYDNVVFNSGLIVVKSAGNHRNDTSATPNGNPADCQQGGFGVDADCIGPFGVAKNVITVGAMENNNTIAPFSSFGPADDGRIKPDIMALGSRITSLSANDVFSDIDNDGTDDILDNSSYSRSGTSMAAPVVSGIVALILEELNNLNQPVSPEIVKCLLIQTAQDVQGTGQSAAGPDYATGWGIADAEASINLIRQNGISTGTISVSGNENAWTSNYNIPNGLPEHRVTLVWTDPPGNPMSATNLVNDLDLRLISPSGEFFQPWILNPSNPGQAAVRNGGDDTINNVEQVSVLNPEEGEWTIQVSAKPGLTEAQSFAIATTQQKSDVVMIVDKSSSMNLNSGEPGISKIDALKTAANEFIDLLNITGGNKLGLVQFNDNVVDFSPSFNLQVLNNTNLTQAQSLINSITAQGRTNIISGVKEASNQISSISDRFVKSSCVLFSDGRHNTPLGSNLNSISDLIQNTNSNFYSIGYGTDVDDFILNSVAMSNGGIHLNAQSLEPIELRKHFLTIGSLTNDLTILRDPLYELSIDETGILDFSTSSYLNEIIIAINWTGKIAKDVEFKIISPDKLCPVKGSDIQVIHRENYKLIKIPLPLPCEIENTKIGKWAIEFTPKGLIKKGKEKVDVMIIGGSSLKARSLVKQTTNKVEVYSYCSFYKKRLKGDYKITNYLTFPSEVKTNSLEQDLKQKEGKLKTSKTVKGVNDIINKKVPSEVKLNNLKQDLKQKEGKSKTSKTAIKFNNSEQDLKQNEGKLNTSKKIVKEISSLTDEKRGLVEIDISNFKPGLYKLRTVINFSYKNQNIQREVFNSFYIK